MLLREFWLLCFVVSLFFFFLSFMWDTDTILFSFGVRVSNDVVGNCFLVFVIVYILVFA